MFHWYWNQNGELSGPLFDILDDQGRQRIDRQGAEGRYPIRFLQDKGISASGAIYMIGHRAN